MAFSIKQTRLIGSLVLVGLMTLTFMTISLPSAQADIIDYTVEANPPFPAIPDLSGTFSYDTLSMTIQSLAITLTNASDSFMFNTSDVTNLTLDGFDLSTLNPSPINVFIETNFTLGTIPSAPNDLFEYEFDPADGMANFTGESTVTGMNTTPPGPAVPEPSTALLMATGLLGLAGYRWKQRHLNQLKSVD